MEQNKTPFAASSPFSHTAAMLALLALAGCGGGGGGGTTNGGGGGTPPTPTVSLSASPNPVNFGGGATLTWSAPNATACTASGAWSGNRPASGSEPTGALTTSATYTLTCTGTGGSANDSVAVVINQPPVANGGCNQTGLNQNLADTLSATDPDGPVSYEIVAPPDQGLVSLDSLTGAFTYTPNANSRGTDTFSFRAYDGQAFSNTATYKVVYTPRIMPLGDSITDGVMTGSGCTSPPGPDDDCPAHGERVGYRKDLKDALTTAGYEIDFVGTLQRGGDLFTDTDHDGHGGWKADELLNGKTPPPDPWTGSDSLSFWLDFAKPDVVLLHAGTNDLTDSGDDSSATTTDIDNIVSTINTWEAAHWPVTVILAGIINTHPMLTSQARQDETTSFNNSVRTTVANPAIAGGDRLIWVDQEAALTSASDYADDLHPSAAGYQKMANVWLYPLAGQVGDAISAGSVFPQPPAAIPPGFLPKCP